MSFRSQSSTFNFATANTSVTVTMPAGVQAGDRVFAFVGNGGTNPVTLTPPAGWTALGTKFAPSSFMSTWVYYRDVASPAEAGGSHVWTFDVASRTWAVLLAYSDADLARTPAVNNKAGVVNSAGPSTAPTVIVPATDWLITFAAGRESPGTEGVKSWSINPADTEHFDSYTSHAGTGAKYAVAAYDSNGVVAAGTGGGSGTGGAVSVGNQAPPTNTYNAIVTSSTPMRIGCTVKKDELTYWKPKLAALDWMRVFPDSDGLPPDWTDPRITFCKDFNAEPFLSSKIDGDNAKLATLSTYLKAMPGWILNHPDPDFFVWITDRHEPEGDVTADQYKANFIEFWNMIQALPSNIRARVKAGPVLTRQWTENTAGRSYATHDPVVSGNAVGDFFGVDMYANSWGSPATTVATSFPNAVSFLSRFKAYRYNLSDTRLRVMPELGGIGIPNDTDGTVRAAWLQALHTEMSSWTVGAQGWPMGGWLWWNTEGKSGTSLNGAGTKRWFTFDRRHTGTDGSYAIIPSVAPPAGGSGGGGSVATDRAVSTNIPISSSHIWSITVPMQADEDPPDPATVNAWTCLGLPQR